MKYLIDYKYYTFFIGLLSYLLLGSCYAQHSNYSFLVAGHVYGSPVKEVDGLYPPFLKELRKNHKQYDFGVFTGDMVKFPSEKKWDILHQQLQLISIPIYFAPGNHDMGDRKLYQELNGNADTCFTKNEDVFLFFDNTKFGWNMDSSQTFLFNDALSKLSIKGRLFVFGHNVLWQDKYECATSNSLEGKGPTSEFWTTVVPQLLKLPNPVYWFAGDVGGKEKSKNISYVKEGNIHMVTSGMGNNVYDNYLKVNVTYTSVSINVVPLNKNSVQPITNFKCN